MRLYVINSITFCLGTLPQTTLLNSNYVLTCEHGAKDAIERWTQKAQLRTWDFALCEAIVMR